MTSSKKPGGRGTSWQRDTSRCLGGATRGNETFLCLSLLNTHDTACATHGNRPSPKPTCFCSSLNIICNYTKCQVSPPSFHAALSASQPCSARRGDAARQPPLLGTPCASWVPVKIQIQDLKGLLVLSHTKHKSSGFYCSETLLCHPI